MTNGFDLLELASFVIFKSVIFLTICVLSVNVIKQIIDLNGLIKTQNNLKFLCIKGQIFEETAELVVLIVSISGLVRWLIV